MIYSLTIIICQTIIIKEIDFNLDRDDFEICWMLSGKLLVSLQGEEHELLPGDAVRFDTMLEHAYAALEESSFIIIHLPKSQIFQK